MSSTHFSASSLRGTVAVAVSGGADSLYTLIRLQEAGVPVMAVHGLFAGPLGLGGEHSLPPSRAEEGPAGDPSAVFSAPAEDPVQEALTEACETLGVHLHIVDCSRPFLDRVVRPFVQAYADGRTPNPCALCNAGIKFGLLLEKARDLGAAHLATGHYARLAREGENAPLAAGSALPCLPALLQGADPVKDQSYFLALVPQASLDAALFPLGGFHKKDVLAALARRGIAVPQPKESQEVCFIPDDAYRAFLPAVARQLGITLPGPGPMLLEDGSRLGTHKGLWQYTEGQRKGLGLGWKEPLYVLGKEMRGNVLRLGPRDSAYMGGPERMERTADCVCTDVNLLLPPELWPETVFLKTRYRERPKAAQVRVERPEGPQGNAPLLHIRFLEPQAVTAPGQVAAVYIPVDGLFEDDGRPVLRLVAGGILGTAS